MAEHVSPWNLACAFLGESENGFVIPDHMDSSTRQKKKNAKTEKGLSCYDRTGWGARNIYVRMIFLKYCSRIRLGCNTNYFGFFPKKTLGS